MNIPVSTTRRSSRARVSKVEPMTQDVTKYEFTALDGSALPDWTAGAHLDVVVTPEYLRQYSMSGDPADPHQLPDRRAARGPRPRRIEAAAPDLQRGPPGLHLQADQPLRAGRGRHQNLPDGRRHRHHPDDRFRAPTARSWPGFRAALLGAHPVRCRLSRRPRRGTLGRPGADACHRRGHAGRSRQGARGLRARLACLHLWARQRS